MGPCGVYRLALLGGFPVTSTAETTNDTAAVEGITLEDIVHVWKRRSARIQSLVMEWEGEITYGKESLFWSPTKVAKLGAEATKLPPVPESDVTFRTWGRLAWDRRNGRFKLQDNAPTWNSETGRHFQQNHIYATTSDHTMSFYGRGRTAPEQLQMRGYIRDRDGEGLRGNVNVAILVTSLFPFGEPLSPVNLGSKWKLLNRQVFVDGHPCLVLEQRLLPDFNRSRLNVERFQLLVVDPAMEFCIVRHTNQDDDTVYWQREFEYKSDDQYGWLPTRCTSLICLGDKRLHQRLEHSVTKCVVNPNMSAEYPELTFPGGTWVKDARNGDEWIVRKQGKGKRRITLAELERGATRAELLATDTGRARISPVDWTHRLVIVGIAVCVSCVYFTFRKNKAVVTLWTVPTSYFRRIVR